MKLSQLTRNESDTIRLRELIDETNAGINRAEELAEEVRNRFTPMAVHSCECRLCR